MEPARELILVAGGLVSGILAGLLGIGGGTVLVPFLVTLGYLPVKSVATSSLAILITSISGSIQNWRMGYVNFKRVFYLGLPAIATAQIGVYLADRIAGYILLSAFGILLLVNIYLVDLRKRLTKSTPSPSVREDAEAVRGEVSSRSDRANEQRTSNFNLIASRIFTGGAAGILAGFFGVGGGVIMVPLQMLLLGEPIKVAIQTSLGVIVITAVSACIGHAIAGNVIYLDGALLGIGGFVGAQISTRVLPKLSDRLVGIIFRTMLAILSVYMFWQAWISYFLPSGRSF
ncbi:MAG: sulfite exporter TauE/SafE family protein [Xenococcaceae cyanobacterium]